MKKLFFLLMTICAVLPLSAQNRKNILNVQYGALPARFEDLLKTQPQNWNFNFKKYGKDAEVLVTDPSIQRNAAAGSDNSTRVTGLYACVEPDGLNILFFTAEPAEKDALLKGQSLPGNSLEVFFLPGDSDNNKIEHHYQFFLDQTNEDVKEYPWLVPAKGYRPILKFVHYEVHQVSNGCVGRLFIPWFALEGRFPFSGKNDTFWRLSVCRWAPGDAQTWGGVVHDATGCGYLRMPEFTLEQKTAIRKATLRKAWIFYKGLLNNFGPGVVQFYNEPYRKALPQLPRSYMNFQEDQVFNETVLVPLQKECDGLGEKIATLEKMTDAEQEAFTQDALCKLMNFDLNVQQAYQKYLDDKLFKE